MKTKNAYRELFYRGHEGVLQVVLTLIQIKLVLCSDLLLSLNTVDCALIGQCHVSKYCALIGHYIVCRTSLICHRAIQHGELRLALGKDDSIPGDFISRLFCDDDNKTSEESSSDSVKVKTEDAENEVKVNAENVEVKDSHKERETLKEEVKRKVLQKLVEIKNIKQPETGKKRKKLDKMQELELRLAEKMRRYGNSSY